jgi:hypothetical protein
MAAFSEPKRQRFEQAMNEMLKQAREMADAVLLTNVPTLEALATELAKRGEMVDTDLANFYETKNRNIDATSFDKLMKSDILMKAEKEKWTDRTPVEGRPLAASLTRFMKRPDSVANIDNLVAEQKAAEIAKVALPENLPIADIKISPPPANGGEGASSSAQTCEMKLELLRLPHIKN